MAALVALPLHASARQGPPPVVNPPIPRTSVTVSMAEFMTAGVPPGQAFAQAVNAARQRQAARLVIPPGVYRIDALNQYVHLVLDDLQDLVIDGQGAEFVFTRPANGFLVTNVRRVVIRNLIVDYDLRLASPGVVQRESDGATTIRVDDAFPIDASTPVQAVTRYTHATRSWAKALPEVYYPANLTLRRAQTLQSPSFGVFTPGTEVIVRHHVYDGVAFHTTTNAADIAYEDVTVFGSPGVAFFVWNADRGLRFSRNRIARRALGTRFVSAASDGIHIGPTRGDIIVEDNDFSGQGDDSLNIHGMWLQVVQIAGNTVTLRRANEGLVHAGDQLRFVRPGDLSEKWRGTAAAVRGTNGPDYVVTLDTAPPSNLALGDLAGNLTRSNARFLVRGNAFHDHRARGMLIQAPQGLVENNTIRDVTMQGLHLTTDAKFFYESTGLDDVVVRGNTISGVGYAGEVYADGRHMAAISLIGDVATGLSSYPVHRHVRIENNTIVDTPGLAVLVASADGVTVQDNTIVRSNQIPFSVLRSGTRIDAAARGSIMVTRASNVLVQRNLEVIAAGRADSGIYVDPRNTSGISVSGNTQQFGPSLTMAPDLVTSRGAPLTTPVVVSDPDTPSANLTLAASSSNTTLLPASGIAFGGSGWERRLTLSPAAGQTGSVAVTVSVSDGGETATRTLTLTVVDGSVLSGQVSGQSVRLAWTHVAVPGLQGSVLEAGFSPGATSVSLPMGTATSFEAVVPSGVYYVRVRALVNGTLAPPGNEITLAVGAAGAPGAPGNLLANVSGGQVRLWWHNAASGGLRTAVRLEAQTPSPGQLVSIDLPASAETFTTAAPPGTYLVRVRALGPALASDPSGDVLLTVPGTCAIPAAPRSVLAAAAGGTVTVTWALGDPGTAAPDTFVLEAGRSPGTTFVSLPLATRTLRAAAPAGTYYLRVRAVSACGASPPSEEVLLVVP
jgi:hypothetical protein